MKRLLLFALALLLVGWQDVTPEATLEAGMFTNPIISRDFPDPDVLYDNGVYYAYATNSDGIHVQAARSENLVEWELLPDALPVLPVWAVPDFGWTWAPEVSKFGEDDYVMYYVTRFAVDAGGRQCIGAAESDTPDGAFAPVGDAPLVCQLREGGSVDPSVFTDEDGTRYLLWKNDGNSGGGQSWIYLQRLSEDGRALEGEPTRLITADQVWEGVLVEAPTLWKRGDQYVLFYSANDYASPRYAIGYAVADTIEGPYTKGQRPLLETSIPNGLVGPGGQDVTLDDDGDPWLLYHAWTPDATRSLNMLPLEWQAGVPTVEPAHRSPQALP